MHFCHCLQMLHLCWIILIWKFNFYIQIFVIFNAYKISYNPNTTLSCMLCLIMSVIKMMVFNCLRYERNYICSKNCSSIYFQKCGTKNQYEKNKPNLETRDWLISFMAHFKVLLHPSFVFSFFIFMVTNSNQFQVFIICLIRNNSQ